MTGTVDLALALWGLEGAAASFVAGRENRVYRVFAEDGDFALRFKRPGYRTDDELASELQWLEALYEAGLGVPRPRPALSGRLLETVGAQHVDMISWLPGKPLGQSRVPLDLPDAPGVFHRLGAAMADFHEACDSWRKPAGFARCSWDIEGLVGEAPVWGRFWNNPALDADARSLLEAFRHVARRDLERLAEGLDYGLIHADLVRENVLVDGQAIKLIDFDDGGWGFRLFDVATALFKNRHEPDYPALETALLAGYRSRRPLDTTALDLFMALRAVSYVGWIVPRIGEEGARDRNLRFIEDAKNLCSDYLRQSSPV